MNESDRWLVFARQDLRMAELALEARYPDALPEGLPDAQDADQALALARQALAQVEQALSDPPGRPR